MNGALRSVALVPSSDRSGEDFHSMSGYGGTTHPLSPGQATMDALNPPNGGRLETPYADRHLPIERPGIAMSEVLRMIRRVGGDVPAEGEADGLAVPAPEEAEEAGERIAHAETISRISTAGKPPFRPSRSNAC